MAKKPANLIGQSFGALLVVGFHQMTKSGSVWFCRCSCPAAGEVLRTTSNLKNTARPGCPSCETARRSAVKVTHGGAVFGKTRLFTIWKDMRKRCRDLSNPYYGGKGVTVCNEWQTFPAFRAWAQANGYAGNLSIDRMNPAEGYSPSNCEWVTRSENSRRIHNPKISASTATQ